MENSHAKSSDEVLAFFDSNEEFGISEQQVAANLHKYGFNGAPLPFYECVRCSVVPDVCPPDPCEMCCSLMRAELPAEESARATRTTLH